MLRQVNAVHSSRYSDERLQSKTSNRTEFNTSCPVPRFPSGRQIRCSRTHTAVCISFRESLVVLLSVVRRKVKHSLYWLSQTFYYSQLGTPHSLQKLTLTLSRKKKERLLSPFCAHLLSFPKFKSLLCPQRTHNPRQPIFFLPSHSPLSRLITHSCPFVCSIILFILSYHLPFSSVFFFYLFLTPVSLSLPHTGYFSSREPI